MYNYLEGLYLALHIKNKYIHSWVMEDELILFSATSIQLKAKTNLI